MVLNMMSYIYSHCRTEGRWLTGVNLQVRTSTYEKQQSFPITGTNLPVGSSL
jgi:hypothetical protein